MGDPRQGAGDAIVLELLGVPVELRCEDAWLASRLRLCYAVSRRSPGIEGRPLAVTLERRAERYRIRVAGWETEYADGPIEAVRKLNHALMHGVMLRCPRLFFVHAAVVDVDGRAVVLPGLSRAGKSTLALALVSAGAGFLSDELLAFDAVRGVAVAFPRAFKIRDACVGYFPAHAAAFVGEGEGRFLPFDALPADLLRGEVPIGAVVVPRWSAEESSTLTRVTKGEALLALAASSLNFGTHRTRSIDLLTSLVQGTRCFRLVWDDPHHATRLLLDALVGAAA